MGSLLGLILANIFLGYHVNKLLSKINFLLTYFRYVDDILIILCSTKDTLMDKANQLHADVKFTLEHENNNKLPFLDVLVDNSDESVITSVYRKPTWSGLYLNFHSFNPMRYKIGLIECQSNRAHKIFLW